MSIATPTTKISLKQIRELLAGDFAAVNQLLLAQLSSHVDLVEEIEQYIVNSGGKRIRPLMALLVARACDYSGDQHITLATIIEFLHTATLLHDDVVDDSGLRRGRKTANVIWGNQASILVGDFLFSRAFQLMQKFQHLEFMRVLADTTNIIAEGEVMQLANCNDPSLSETAYLNVIDCKTAKLFEATCQLAAMIAGKDVSCQNKMAIFGKNLGLAFQIKDDLLDYMASEKDMGKNQGDDLAEGKMTLPLIYAMQHCDNNDKQLIHSAIVNADKSDINEIILVLEKTKALDYCQKQALHYSMRSRDALNTLPESEFRSALSSLLDIVISRPA